MKKLLVFLKYYAEWHFNHEEKCADACHCPFSNANKKAHAYLIEKFGKLHDEYRQNELDDTVARTVHKELLDWIVNLVLKLDKEIELVTWNNR